MRNAYLMMHPKREDRTAIAEQIVSILHAEGMTVSTGSVAAKTQSERAVGI